MAIVKGESVLLKFFNGTDFLPFACARSITVNLKSDIIGKSTVGSGDWKEKEVVALDWNFSIEGIMYLQKSGFDDTEDIIDLWLAKTAVLVQFFITDTASNDIQMTGFALITGVSPTGSVNNVGSVSITGEGTGELSKGSTINYGNYPLEFQIAQEHTNTPTPGQSTLDLVWEAATPTPDEYSIKIVNTTSSTTTFETGTTSNAHSIVINDLHTYSIYIASVYFGGVGISDYSPAISYP